MRIRRKCEAKPIGKTPAGANAAPRGAFGPPRHATPPESEANIAASEANIVSSEANIEGVEANIEGVEANCLRRRSLFRGRAYRGATARMQCRVLDAREELRLILSPSKDEADKNRLSTLMFRQAQHGDLCTIGRRKPRQPQTKTPPPVMGEGREGVFCDFFSLWAAPANTFLAPHPALPHAARGEGVPTERPSNDSCKGLQHEVK